ncbi:unnamed protein product [Ostreobium quekettii]|uniref:Uncharacterized protein n=1 Tax=Ostreobium quekettii TaxID=121088 RepID=A0A8S1ITL4_9CHLO|nr:unnamed protein product [Ostreobium quekettii]
MARERALAVRWTALRGCVSYILAFALRFTSDEHRASKCMDGHLPLHTHYPVLIPTSLFNGLEVRKSCFEINVSTKGHWHLVSCSMSQTTILAANSPPAIKWYCRLPTFRWISTSIATTSAHSTPKKAITALSRKAELSHATPSAISADVPLIEPRKIGRTSQQYHGYVSR